MTCSTQPLFQTAAIVGFISAIATSSLVLAQDVKPATATQPVNRVLKVDPTPTLLNAPKSPNDHPLASALRLAASRHEYIRKHVDDYTCMLVKRERIDGKLRGYEFLEVKFRSERQTRDVVETPFSVYVKYLSPRSMKGREILYIKGQNGGDMLARKGGRRAAYLDAWIDPNGSLAMRESRYPITEFGIENLLAQLVHIAKRDMQYGECEVRIVENAKLDGRPCTAIEVRHPVPRDHFQFHLARIMIDNEMRLPVHYASYSWPVSADGKPPLLEEYTYRNLQINVGLTDDDFSREHPDYGFRKS